MMLRRLNISWIADVGAPAGAQVRIDRDAIRVIELSNTWWRWQLPSSPVQCMGRSAMVYGREPMQTHKTPQQMLTIGDQSVLR